MESHVLLKTLKTAQTPLTRAELARLHSCTRPTITAAISPLVAGGLVTRTEERDAHNRRVYSYSLPDAGNPLQVRHFNNEMVSVRCVCGARRRLQHVGRNPDVYLLLHQSADCQHVRVFAGDELV